MIQQFAELGQFFTQREALSPGPTARLAQFTQDPAAKFRTKTVLVLVFASDGFKRVQVEDYGDEKKLWYLYRAGPPNGWDARAGVQSPRRHCRGNGRIQLDDVRREGAVHPGGGDLRRRDAALTPGRAGDRLTAEGWAVRRRAPAARSRGPQHPP